MERIRRGGDLRGLDLDSRTAPVCDIGPDLIRTPIEVYHGKPDSTSFTAGQHQFKHTTESL